MYTTLLIVLVLASQRCGAFQSSVHRIYHEQSPRVGDMQQQKFGFRPLFSSREDGRKNNKTTDRSVTKPRLGRKEGVYVRPSGAIERGSGFFVPGLEGSKVRVLFGIVLLAATALNHVLSSSPTLSHSTEITVNSFLEGLAASYSILLLVQTGIENRINTRRESLVVEGASSPTPTSSATAIYQQKWFIPVITTTTYHEDGSGKDWKDRVEYVAQSYLTLTPATHMTLLGPGSIVYWLGETAAPAQSEIVVKGCQAALQTCFASQSGRVSLPLGHPVVQALMPGQTGNESSTTTEPFQQQKPVQQCFVLQKVDESYELCWMITSNQRLESFTKRDLQWLGQLAVYTQQSLPSV